MPLTLLIFRHAKSNFDAPSDHERVLTEYGQQQAMFMGELLEEKSLNPDYILCSSAFRARETLELAMSAGKWECDSSVTGALYETTAETTLGLIKQMSDDDKIIMLVGHEPVWSDLASRLTDENISFNTAGMCCISFTDSHWNDVEFGAGFLEWYENPEVPAG